MKRVILMLSSAVSLVCAAADGFVPVDVSFARGKWNEADFEYVKSARWDFFNRFEQADDAIVNCTRPDLTPEQVFRQCHSSSYVAMLHRQWFTLGVEVCSRMSWDYLMAPIIVIAPEFGESAKGEKELRDHYEVCLYNEGINVWHHYFVDGKQRWYKAAALRFADKADWYQANVRHDLQVKLFRNAKGFKELIVTCGRFVLSYVDDKLPEKFRLGVIGCEGRNWFYDFRVNPVKGK